MRSSASRLVHATGRLARTLTHGLASEGASRRQVARQLGISHQRVTALLRDDSNGDSASPTATVKP